MKGSNTLLMELLEYGKIVVYAVKQLIILLQSFKQKMKIPFYASMSNGQKTLFSICSFFLSVYFTFVIYIGHNRLLFTGRSMTILVFITSLLLILVMQNFIIFAYYKLRSYGIYTENKKSLRGVTIIIFSLLCWLPLFCSLLVRFPGLTSPDTIDQWNQVQTFMFNDWHPVIHTLLIWLVTRIVNHYGFTVFIQISVFSIGVGCLIATLESWGISKRLLFISGLFIVINPYTWKIMMYLWKDLSFTVLLTYTAIMMINIYYSDGLWFNKISNIISFSIVVAFASMVRHNGIFFTVPLLILVLMFYFKHIKKVVIAVISTLIIIFVVKIPLYSALKVEFPHNTYPEIVGIPMTIMGDVLIKNPNALSPETKTFLYSILTDEQWHSFYKPGYYNSIKWFKDDSSVVKRISDVIKAIPVHQFLKMTLHTIKNSKREAFNAFCDVTAIVWKIDISYDFTRKTGVLMLTLLFAGIFALSKNHSTALLLVVPSLMYNLGTMLLLCGPDTRFFHFNAVITLPIVLVLLSEKQPSVLTTPAQSHQ